MNHTGENRDYSRDIKRTRAKIVRQAKKVDELFLQLWKDAEYRACSSSRVSAERQDRYVHMRLRGKGWNPYVYSHIKFHVDAERNVRYACIIGEQVDMPACEEVSAIVRGIVERDIYGELTALCKKGDYAIYFLKQALMRSEVMDRKGDA